jgi:hypothetical protein
MNYLSKEDLNNPNFSISNTLTEFRINTLVKTPLDNSLGEIFHEQHNVTIWFLIRESVGLPIKVSVARITLWYLK